MVLSGEAESDGLACIPFPKDTLQEVRVNPIDPLDIVTQLAQSVIIRSQKQDEQVEIDDEIANMGRVCGEIGSSDRWRCRSTSLLGRCYGYGCPRTGRD